MVKISKKLISILLALCLVFGSSITCFAAGADSFNLTSVSEDAEIQAKSNSNQSLVDKLLRVPVLRWFVQLILKIKGDNGGDKPTPDLITITKSLLSARNKSELRIAMGTQQEFEDLGVSLTLYYSNGAKLSRYSDGYTIKAIKYNEKKDIFTVNLEYFDPYLKHNNELTFDIKSEFEYYLQDDGTYGIEGYFGNESDVVIPDYILENSKVQVTKLYKAFKNYTALTNITIPNTITIIGVDAFKGCTGLTSVTIPDSVTYIDLDAFMACSNLTNVTIPNNVTTLEDGAFQECVSLKQITLPNRLTKIGMAVFALTGLEKITIPDSVTEIKMAAFEECYNLTDVTLGKGLKTIGWGAFGKCTALKSIIIPDNVDVIGFHAFYSCTNLTSITIGSGVTEIGDCAFISDDALTDIYYNGSADDWKKINISLIGNKALDKATKHYIENLN